MSVCVTEHVSNCRVFLVNNDRQDARWPKQIWERDRQLNSLHKHFILLLTQWEALLNCKFGWTEEKTVTLLWRMCLQVMDTSAVIELVCVDVPTLLCSVVFPSLSVIICSCLHSRPKIPRGRCGGAALFRNCQQRPIPCFRYPHISLERKVFYGSLWMWIIQYGWFR